MFTKKVSTFYVVCVKTEVQQRTVLCIPSSQTSHDTPLTRASQRATHKRGNMYGGGMGDEGDVDYDDDQVCLLFAAAAQQAFVVARGEEVFA